MKNTAKISKNETMENPNKVYPGYPTYPASEDIYNMGKEETEIDPEDISRKKVSNTNDGKFNEKTFDEDKSGSDLDIPGDELDKQEDVGSEDEENHGYSLGGDNHNDLEENTDRQ